MGRTSGLVGGVTEAVQIILKKAQLETALDRIKEKKAFLDEGGGRKAGASGGGGYRLPTMNEYEARRERYATLLRKYGQIIARDVATIQAAAERIDSADNS